MINTRTHRFLGIIDVAESVFRFAMKDGDVFILKDCYPIDDSIYERKGEWSGQIVSMISDPANKFHKSGNGLDFLEDDIIRIYDETTGTIIFSGEFVNRDS